MALFEERYSQEGLRRILDVSISELRPKYRIAFQLRVVEGLTTDETARVLGLSVAACAHRITTVTKVLGTCAEKTVSACAASLPSIVGERSRLILSNLGLAGERLLPRGGAPPHPQQP
jgi:hypothetical protein